MANPNALRWDGTPGHYEVHYLSLTDGATGLGAWIRMTMLAPLAGEATCSLWFMAMDPQRGVTLGRKTDLPVAQLSAATDPFALRVGDAELTDTGMRGALHDTAWDLAWAAGRAYEHVHPLLRRAGVASTILVLPNADVEVTGTITLPGRTVHLDGARGGQAHLWGTEHARRWTWAHCNDFRSLEGEPRPDTFLDGVSVFVSRFGREIGPSTPVLGRFGGSDFRSTSPLRVLRNPSRFGLTSWAFEATDGGRRIVGEVDARREDLVGVTYHDPDGEKAYCYNSEVASMRLHVWERTGRGAGGWTLRDTLVSGGRAHFEYAQREPVPGLDLHVR